MALPIGLLFWLGIPLAGSLFRRTSSGSVPCHALAGSGNASDGCPALEACPSPLSRSLFLSLPLALYRSHSRSLFRSLTHLLYGCTGVPH